MNKEIKDLCDYIKQNPKCIIEYCDNDNWVIYKSNAHYKSSQKSGATWYEK